MQKRRKIDKVPKGEEKPTKLVQDTKYPNMWRLKWANGDLSEDVYNLPRAHDILRHYALCRENMRKGIEYHE